MLVAIFLLKLQTCLDLSSTYRVQGPHSRLAHNPTSSSTIPYKYHLHLPPPVKSPPPITAPIPASTPTPIPETDPEPLEHTFEEPSPATPTLSNHKNLHPHREHSPKGQMTVDDLLKLVPQLMTKIDSLEKDLKQTKLTMGSAIVKLVKKVKKLEGVLKRRNVVLSDSEEEEPESQGEIKDDPYFCTEYRIGYFGERRKAKQYTLFSLLAQRLAEEEELNEQQKQRRAQVQFEAQHYTDEDWDLIRAKIEANAELSKSVLGSGLQGEDFAKKMVELVNQRKKHFAEERARAKRNKPMTQSQLRTYMMNYLKNQGTWKLSQLKNLSFEEVKEEFDKLVKQVESFAPINFEATKDSLKRFGEELQTKTSKRLKSDEAKDDEPTKKTGKRRKQIARKGLHTDLDKDDSEDSDEASEQDDSASGLTSPEQTATGKGISNPFMAAMVYQKPYGIQLTNVNVLKLKCFQSTMSSGGHQPFLVVAGKTDYSRVKWLTGKKTTTQ
ncbi:hypothetical protein Tco_0322703 [Tanacetum coccineum]